MFLHSELGPHGDGLHGSCGSSSLTGGFGWHLENPSPIRSTPHEQIGAWLTARQTALEAQGPGQTATQRCCTQALVKSHSELVTHSGLQEGGVPIKFCRHEQTAKPFWTLQTLLGPQGLGWHGSCGCSMTRIGSTIFIQALNAFPWCPTIHSQLGTWLYTTHSALIPQTPGHGSKITKCYCMLFNNVKKNTTWIYLS